MFLVSMNACCCDGAQERCRELEAQLAELNLDLEVSVCSNPQGNRKQSCRG